jgi:hypothetical protein
MRLPRTSTIPRPGTFARTALAALLAYASLGVATARAACGPDATQLPRLAPTSPGGVLVPAAYRILPIAGPGGQDNAIVGMWFVEFDADAASLATYNLTNPIDRAFTQWHSDGTEIMNSNRPPDTQSFCLGVWKKTGTSYHLNHWAQSWDGGSFLGVANIQEDVTVDNRGDTYSGSFTIDQWVTGGFDTSSPAPVHITGQVAAQRITP